MEMIHTNYKIKRRKDKKELAEKLDKYIAIADNKIKDY
jgi:hypothetical protein